MHCTVLIPDLLPPSELGRDIYDGIAATGIATALARGDTVKSTSVPVEDWLCERFGVARQHDRPLAALMLKADGGEPGPHYWFCAEPIAVRIDRDRLVVARRIDDYSDAETAELIAALNAHFNADGLHLVAPKRARWYLRARGIPDISTTPLSDTLNRSVHHHLPQGAEALAWHRVMNEAQMILHTHRVNEAREADGIPVSNSIWLWGGGTLARAAQTPFATTWGGQHLVNALSAAAGITHHALPQDANDWLAGAANTHHLIVCNKAAAALRNGDLSTWRQSIETADAQWIRPLLAALRSGRLETLTLIACNRENLVETNMTRNHSWRFWRRVRPLAAYAGNA